ncbi:MAG: mechanosensitive ion channel family protein [Methanotrichaceae archaeon]|nr:mechanosensitive ion channel family protein [Methanotrichaceae archaeon]
MLGDLLGPLEGLSSFSLHISAEDVAIFFLIILLTLATRRLALYLLEKELARLAGKTSTELDNILVKALIGPVSYLVLIAGGYLAVDSLHLPEEAGGLNLSGIIDSIFFLGFAVVALYLLLNLIDLLGYYLHKITLRTETRLDEQLVPLIIKSLKIGAVIFTVLSIVQTLGWNVTTLIAGLGIGYLALALAAQETVSNIFGSITVFSDRAFQLGDWISVDGVEGTVEDIGLRSTKIKRFDQALVTVPNSRFIKSDIVNFTRMKKRRINFTLGVSYETTRAQMIEAVDGIKAIIKEDSRFDHNFYMVHFTDFGDSSLGIFIYCFTKTTVWDEFLAVREEFNLSIMALLEDLGVEIAYPTQTIYLRRRGSGPQVSKGDMDEG